MVSEYINRTALTDDIQEAICAGELSLISASDVRPFIDKAPAVAASVQWVRVSDRLPKEKKDVLMCFCSGSMAVGFLGDVEEGVPHWCSCTDDGWYKDYDYQPTYWAELPKPPKEADNG